MSDTTIKDDGRGLSIVNPHPKRLPGPSLLHHLIADANTPGTALEYHDSDGLSLHISYADLHIKTDHLARLLRKYRKPSPSIIPLLIPQCAALYITQIAILKSGSAFCPMNLDVPEDRLKFILEDISANAVVTTPEHQDKFKCVPNIQVIVLDHAGEVQGSDATTNASAARPSDPSPTHPAYIMYTSGSTGTPKAVCVPHSAATQSLLAHDRFIPQFARFLQFANPTFDVSVFEIFFPFFRGKTLVSCERTHLLSDLSANITSLGVDAAELTPSVVANLVRTQSSVPKLRTLLTIGEMLNPQTVREFAGTSVEDSRLYGMYGPTEAAIHCTLQPAFKRDETVNTIGIPFDTVSCFIIRPVANGSDPNDIQILLKGEVGELAVGGHQLADGYLNRDEQTKAVFVSHPTYGPLYRTGDKARLTDAGLLECLGRISKGQVKLRGQRIELGEIEHAASKLEGVHGSSASVIDGQLILFCLIESANLTTSDIEASCKKWLPKFMVPNEIILLKEFPYLPSGKTDTKKLESDYGNRCSQESDNDEAPPDAAKPLIDLLGSTTTKQIQSSTTLASIAVDSLRAIKLAADVKKQGYRQISAVDVLNCTNVGELWRAISEDRPISEADDFSSQFDSIVEDLRRSVLDQPESKNWRDLIRSVLPCTPLQDAMLVETAKDSKAYCNSITLEISRPIALDDLKDAFKAVAQQHTMLRSGFVQVEDSSCIYALVEWAEPLDDHFNEATEVEHTFNIAGPEDLLRPFQVQLHRGPDSSTILISLHHALYDQWSIDILIEDLYRAMDGQRLPERPSFMQASRHAQAIRSSSTRQDQLKKFWRGYMSESQLSRLPNLTGKRSRSKAVSAISQASTIGFGDLEAVSAILEVSVPILVQTAYAYVLSLYTGQRDLTFGSVFSGRTGSLEGVTDLIGPLLSTLPLRASFEDAATFASAASEMQRSSRMIMSHADSTIADIRKAAELNPASPLFDSIFVWQGTARDNVKQDVVHLIETTDFVEYDLILDVEAQGEAMQYKVTHRESVLPSAHARLFCQQLDAILSRVISKSKTTFAELFNMREDYSCQSVYNPRPELYDCEGGLPRLLAKSFEHHKSRPALIFLTKLSDTRPEMSTLSFAELDEQSNQLANHLIDRGVKTGGIICIIMEKSIDLYITILAAIKTGCGYLPIVPTTPVQRIEKILKDADVHLVMCDASTMNTLAPLGINDLVCLDRDTARRSSSQHPNRFPSIKDTAYAVYTSGTTGRPKGVLVSQANIVSNLIALSKLYPVGGNDRLLQSCNQAFDVSVFEIFFTWFQGMCLCSATNDVLFKDLEQSIRTLEITHLSMTPTVAALVDPQNVPLVKFLVTAGEAVTSHVHQKWAGRGLYQGYGPSETTNICTVSPSVTQDDTLNNIGPAFANTSAFVLPISGSFTPLPIGALGELCFGGQQVFKGYQNMEELTASKIIEHPEYGRIYRSGDLGRMRHDGVILIEGRVDTQRKIRGQRIELGEITTQLVEHDAVSDAVVLVLSSGGNEILVGFWIPRAKAASRYEIMELSDDLCKECEGLREHLQSELPSYMVPSLLVPISALPMTAQSKIDTKLLTADFESLDSTYRGRLSGEDQEDDTAEWSPTELQVRAAVAEVLKINENAVGRNASLFGVGLDSLSAIRLSRRLMDLTGAQLEISKILKSPRIASLSSLIDGEQTQRSDDTQTAAHTRTYLWDAELSAVRARCEKRGIQVKHILPCTPLQEAMLSSSMGENASAYLNRTILRVQITADLLRGYWTTMVQRHEILRTVFLSSDDAKYPFVQVTLDKAELPWHEMESAVDSQALLKSKDRPTLAPLDSDSVPWQLSFLKGKKDNLLVIEMHHVLYDANAFTILFDEIEKLHRSEKLSEPISIEPFIRHMVDVDSNAADEYFAQMLSGFSLIRTSSKKDVKQTFSQIESQLAASSDDLQAFQEKHAVSLLALCQAAWTKVLSIANCKHDVCFGNVVSGRSLPVSGIDRLVAPCFNTIPVRMDAQNDKTNLEVVESLHQLNIDALPYQLTALRRIQQNNSEGSPLFQSLLLVQQVEEPLDSTMWTLQGEQGDMDFPCIFEVTPRHDGRIDISLHYQDDLISSTETAEAVCAIFSSALSHILRYPFSNFNSFSSTETQVIAGIWRSENANMDPKNPASEDRALTDLEVKVRDVLLSYSPAGKSSTVTADTSIYRLGLDSISAIQVAKKLKDMGHAVTAADVMEHSTIAALARFIEQDEPAAEMSAVSFDFDTFASKHKAAILERYHLDEKNIDRLRPCTAVQAGMLTAFVQSQGRNYLNHVAYELDVSADAEAVSMAWNKVISEHFMLRTGFAEVDDEEHPFSMLAYSTSALPTIVSTAESKLDYAYLEQENRREILAELHRPAWRCHFRAESEQIILFISIHHAIYDAASWSAILADFEKALSGARVSSEPEIDPALSLILQQNHDEQDAKTFWTERLAQMAISRFPNLHPVVPKSTSICDVSRVCEWPRSTFESRSSDGGAALQAVFEAAWARVLAAYSGEPQVTFGIVQSGRAFAQTENAVFPCINTQPLTCNAEVRDTELLKMLAGYNAAVQKHCFTPLSSIQKWTGHGNEALFDTIFAFQKPMTGPSEAPKTRLVHEKATVDYAVSIEVEYLPGDQLRLRTTFDSTVLPEKQAEVLLKQIESIAMSLLQQDESKPVDSSIMAVVPAKDPEISTSAGLLQDLVKQSVENNPSKIALEFVHSIDDDNVQSSRWSYQELDRKANQVANLLHDHGTKAGDVVGLCFEKCPEASFAFLGILKAGCTILAIDATAPSARKDFMLSDSGASAVLCSSKIAAEAEQLNVKVIDLTVQLTDDIAAQEPELGGASTPESICYILYTSGTTGTPKGCELTHDNSVQALLAFQRLFKGRWTDESVWLQFASYHFDVAILEHFWSWSVGIKLLCAPRDMILEDIAEFIDRFQVTHLDLTPSLGRLLDPASVPSLHSGVFITGGEAVKPEMLRNWGKIGCLFNFYGPTECTIGVTTFPSVPTNGKAANIGWQFDNVGTCVLTPGGDDPVLRGGVGELCIFGRLVGKGYLKRPDLNESRFPYNQRLFERIYRTGDLVRVLHDNSFEFLGRADSQVKLRGQRLEIDEIVAVMMQVEAVKDAVCIVARQEEQQKDQLVAFISASTDRRQGTPRCDPTSADQQIINTVRAACEDRLPVYMVPTHFVPIDFVPLSVNNKQDDKVLKQLYKQLSVAQLKALSVFTEDERDLNDIEKEIVSILTTMLSLEAEQVTSSSSLFSLGLTSISAVQLARRLRSAGRDNSSVTVVMQNPTIAKLAKALNSASDSGVKDQQVFMAEQKIAACRQRYLHQAAKTLGIAPSTIQAIAPCTPLQQGILYGSQSSSTGLYFNKFSYRIDGLNLDVLHEAFVKLVEATEIYRTVFIETVDGHVQVCLKKAQIQFEVIKVENPEEVAKKLAEAHQSWIEASQEALHHPFRITVVGDGQCQTLQISVHHVLYDGNSWDLTIARLTALYKRQDTTDASSSSFFKTLAHGPLRDVKEAKQFWAEQLARSNFDRLHSIDDDSAGGDHLTSRSISTTEPPSSIAKKLGVTTQAVLQAAWLATLSKYHAGPIGIIVSGRSLDVDAQNVIGPLFNTIPYAWKIVEGDTWEVFSKRCHDFNTWSLPFQQTPIRDIQKWAQLRHGEATFDTLFVYQQPRSDADGVEQLFRAMPEEGYAADYPLSFEVEEQAGGALNINLGVKAGICGKATAANILQVFEQNLAALVGDPSQVITIPEEYTASTASTSRTTDVKDLNGYQGHFEWTGQAKLLRTEFAGLANVSESEIDEHTSIFSIGIDSIDAIKLSARLKKHGIKVPVSALMRYQTIPRILEHVSVPTSRTDANDDKAEVWKAQQEALEKAVRESMPKQTKLEKILPATPMQEGLVAEMLAHEYKAYFNHDVLRVSQDTDLNRLEQAWSKVVSASPILRTAFVPIDSSEVSITFAQVILQENNGAFSHETSSSKGDLGALLDKITRDIASAEQPVVPLRLTIASIDNEDYLILSMAHALYDGYSLGLLHDDVRAAYNDTFEPRPAYDMAITQAIDASTNDANSFWQGMLSSSRPTLITEQDLSSSRTHRRELSSSTSSTEIKTFCQQNSITVQALTQTVWALHLATMVKALDVTFGLVLAGRDEEDTERILFPVMNTVATRAVLSGSVADLLRTVQEQIVEMMAYQQTPLRRIQHLARQVSPDVRGALFNTLFTYQKRPSASTEASESALYKSVGGSADVDYPIAVEAEIEVDNLIWRTAVKSSVGNEQMTEEMLHNLDGLLSRIIAGPGTDVLSFTGKRVSVLGGAEFEVFERSHAGKPDKTVDQQQDATIDEKLEQMMREVIVQVAKVSEEEVTRNTRLENLGIDSINAIKLSSLLKKKAVLLPVSKIIRAGTLGGLARAAAEGAGAAINGAAKEQQSESAADFLLRRGITADSLGRNAADLEYIMPATAGQTYMLACWINSRGTLFYPTFTYRLQGCTDLVKLESAWNRLVEQEPILRTSFAATGDEEVPFVQIVEKANKESFTVLSEAKEETVDKVQPFAHLSAGSEDIAVLLKLSLHHALYDAVNLAALMQRLTQLVLGEGIQTTSSADLLQRYTPSALKKQQSFWKKNLDGMPREQRPDVSALVNYQGPRIELFNPAVLRLTADNYKALRTAGVSIQSLFFATYAQVYAHTHDLRGDVVVGVYLANRADDDEIAQTTPTVNLVPLRIRTGSWNLPEIAKQVQTDLRTISSSEAARTSLWDVYRWTGVQIDTFVNFIHLPEQDADDTPQSGVTNGGVSIRNLDDEREFLEREGVHPVHENAFTVPKELQAASRVGEAYPASLDIEATVRNDTLAVGVFGYEKRVELDLARGIVEELGKEIGAFFEKA